MSMFLSVYTLCLCYIITSMNTGTLSRGWGNHHVIVDRSPSITREIFTASRNPSRGLVPPCSVAFYYGSGTCGLRGIVSLASLNKNKTYYYDCRNSIRFAKLSVQYIWGFWRSFSYFQNERIFGEKQRKMANDKSLYTMTTFFNR